MNRTLAALLFAIASPAISAGQLPSGPLPETTTSDIGYSTVAEALSSLQKRQDVSTRTVRGWLIIADSQNLSMWSFAPPSYPAYPAVVRRVVEARQGGGSIIHTSVLCEASKEVCDQLVRDFAALNHRIPGTTGVPRAQAGRVG